MKLTRFVSLLILFGCLFCSCQKEIDGSFLDDGSDSTINTNSSLVKAYSEETVSTDLPDLNAKDSFALQYDDKGRQISFKLVDSVNQFKIVYKYNGDSTIKMDQTSSDDSPLHEILYLNNDSLVDSTLQYNEGDTTTEKYIYNANKQLLHIYEYEYTTATGGQLSATSSYEYDNAGNRITETTGSSVTRYTFANNSKNTIGNIGLLFLPQQKLLPDTYQAITDNISLSGTHTYTYDSQNRLIMDKQIFTGDANGYSIKRYSY